MQRKTKILWFLFFMWLLWISTYFLIKIELNGDKEINLKLGEQYVELGATASMLHNNLDVTVKSNVNTNNIGTYVVSYKSRNFLGIARTVKRIVKVYDNSKPQIKLRGSNLEKVILNDSYIEKGYKAIDKIDGDITDKVVVQNNVDTTKEGIYEITYMVQDSSHNKTVVKRMVQVQKRVNTYLDLYDKIDNNKRSWWTDNKFNQIRPNGGADIDVLREYNAYFLGKDEKIIYLTFDEGSNDTYLNEIANLLTKNNIAATFFLCGHFMEDHKNEIQKWVSNGHSIGNHTFHHRDAVSYATEDGFKEFQKEIIDMETLYQNIIGKPMDKIFRSPKGEWSYRELQIVKDMGYRSYFWSADYLDFDKTYSKEYALEQLLSRYHKGAIYMLHPKQKGTYEALQEFINKMKGLGYKFGLVKDIY